MRYVIVGAGAVGGSIGGRLAEAGQDVALVARGAQYDAVREHGLTLTTPDGTRVHRIPVFDRPEALGLRADDVLLLAVKTQDSAAALDAWAARPVEGGGTAAETLPLVCAQNGVESERLAVRSFRHVYAMCVWLPATFVEPGTVYAGGRPYTGILNLGRYPDGTDENAHRIAAGLEKGKLLAPVVPDVMRWKYNKLLTNLSNAIGAITGSATGEGAEEIRRLAVAEGRAVLAAAGIEAASPEEEARARGDLMDLDPAGAPMRGGNSSWQSLSRGTGTIETDYLNGEIVRLGRAHSVPTPVNETLRRVADTFAHERRAPGSMTAADLLSLFFKTGDRTPS